MLYIHPKGNEINDFMKAYRQIVKFEKIKFNPNQNKFTFYRLFLFFIVI